MVDFCDVFFVVDYLFRSLYSFFLRDLFVVVV